MQLVIYAISAKLYASYRDTITLSLNYTTDHTQIQHLASTDWKNRLVSYS
jgi:hypothetical protein